MKTNPLAELPKLGQSIWYDQMQRSLVSEGSLARMIQDDDLRGLTSNPTIFEKAIGGSTEYDMSVVELAQKGLNRDEIYEALVVEDIGAAADVFRPVYDRTKGLDGYVSLEVNPTLAHDAQETIAEGTKLFGLLDRPNVMIKVPATSDGLPAIEELIYRGINVNVTLIFSGTAYEKVMDAYLRGLERRLAEGKPLDRIASVASFFVSRIDSKVDAALEKKIAASSDDAEKGRYSALLGKIAIANAKVAYELFQQVFGSPRFIRLRDAGANVQRPLWASTGTKNKNYSDVLYLEELIGPDTVNTVPPATYDAFRDHGRVGPTLTANVAEARAQLAELANLGISLDAITDELTREGVKSFSDSFVSLMKTIESRRDVILRSIEKRGSLQLGSGQSIFDTAMTEAEAAKTVTRIWKRDASLWKDDEANQKNISSFLGWLDAPEKMLSRLDEITSFVGKVSGRFDHIVLLGMGGSSLCAEVLRRSFGPQPGAPQLHVLDSTVPATVLRIERGLDLKRTLFIVASKSGSTIEPSSFFRYFLGKMREAVGESAGDHFIAITDAGTQLERESGEERFLHAFVNPSDIGGRYSALSLFGLVPAALAGIDAAKFLDRGVHAQHACSDSVALSENPGLMLGVAIGALARAGRNKLTLVSSREIESLGLWVEQLVAESTGKEGKGIVPIAGEALTDPAQYGSDRFFVVTTLGEDGELQKSVRALKSAGQPVIELRLRDLYDLADIFYVWEFATAVAGSLLKINPFDQPNVQESKDNTNRLLRQLVDTGALPERQAQAREGELEVYASAVPGSTLAELVSNLLSSVRPGDYLAITQYIDEHAGHEALIQQIREAARRATRAATTTGYGPRFLHSTGQLHKGGADNAVFLQISSADVEDAPLPNAKYSFGGLKDAQATGDFEALASRGRRALAVRLGHDTFDGLRQILAVVEQASLATK
jgi:transaldolase/glucose-6-phosphate isomerase